VERIIVAGGQCLELVEQPLPLDLVNRLLKLLEPPEVPQASAEVKEVHMGEEIGLLVVETFKNLQSLLGSYVSKHATTLGICVLLQT
jgi:hypothetical protein